MGNHDFDDVSYEELYPHRVWFSFTWLCFNQPISSPKNAFFESDWPSHLLILTSALEPLEELRIFFQEEWEMITEISAGEQYKNRDPCSVLPTLKKKKSKFRNYATMTKIKC